MTWDLQITSDGRIEVINRSGRDTAYFVRVSHPRLDAPGEVEEVGPGSGVGCWLKPWAYGTPKVTDPVEITWYADRDKSGDQLKAVRALP